MTRFPTACPRDTFPIMATAHPLPLPAPLDWDDFTAEQRAEIEQSLADVAAGRAKLVPHAEVQRVIAEMRRQDR